MNNGRKFFFMLMGVIVSLYAAFVVIGRADQGEQPAAGDQAEGVSIIEQVESDLSDGTQTNQVGSEEDISSEGDSEQVKGDDSAVVEEGPVVVPEDSPIVVPEDEAVKVVDETVVVSDEIEDPGAGETVFVSVDVDDGEIPGATAEKSAVRNTISISLDDVEMADVVRMFTRISGANIIASPSNLVGRVTANLDDVEWQSAMITILDMHGLALMESPPGSKIFRIDPKVPGAPEPMRVRTYFLKYAQVSNSTTVVSSMLTPGGTLQAFPSRNALVVRSTSSNLAEIQEVIDSIDVLRDQVFIEAKFMELNDSAIKDLGINWQVLQGYAVSAGNLGWSMSENRNWDASRQQGVSRADNRAYEDTLSRNYNIDGVAYEDSTTSYEEAPPGSGVYVPVVQVTPTREVRDTVSRTQDRTADAADTYARGISDVRTAVLGVDDFRLVLSALRQMNGVQIVSNPKLIVANEERATIHIGQVERPFEAVVTPATQVEASTTKYTPGPPINFGVSLEVIPTINTASNITVAIMPELTRFVANRTAPDGATYPVVASKKIRTMFCLESGKTVAIGGLTETVEQETVKKIPLLGDIPLIGKYLFSHTHTSKEQKETIIFVTVGLAHPETVNEYDGLPEDTELTHDKIMEQRLRRHKFNQRLEQNREKIEEEIQKSERVKSHLLKSK